MPALKQLTGVMNGVTFEMLTKYLNVNFPNMNIVQITQISDKEYQFILQSETTEVIQ